MQKNFQPPKQFIADIGRILAKQSAQTPPARQRQALTNLGEYLATARRHHALTWTTLAQQTGKSEAELYALEQGLLPYTQIDFPFLCRLATALDEEVETLTLLMGQSIVSLPTPSKPNLAKRASLYYRTSSQRFDNWLATLPLINLLYKRSMNLVDFGQEGRLFTYTRANYGSRGWMGVTVGLLACLLLLWVSTYSLAGSHRAQSYATLAVETSALHQNALSAHATTTSSAVPTVHQVSLANLPQLSRQPARQIAKAAVAPADQERSTPSAVFLPSAAMNSPQGSAAASQLCDFRTMGRFSICRV